MKHSLYLLAVLIGFGLSVHAQTTDSTSDPGYTAATPRQQVRFSDPKEPPASSPCYRKSSTSTRTRSSNSARSFLRLNISSGQLALKPLDR
jgi:hypothetical protein